MVNSEGIREKIMDRAPVGKILAIAKSEGLRFLREDGWVRVREGVTTPEEIIRATKA